MLKNAQITDAEIYLDDKSLIGICEEFTIPEIEHTKIDHETLGSVGVFQMPARGLNALNGTMTMSFPEPELMAMTSNPTKAARFQLHSKLDGYDIDGLNEGGSTTLVTHVVAMFSKTAFPGGKRKEAGKHTVEFSALRLMQKDLNGSAPLVEIDLPTNVYKVNGQNVWT